MNVPEAAVRPVGTLHLTLGVMSFPKDEGLERAIALLEGLKPRQIWADIKPPRMPGQAAGGNGTTEKGKEVAGAGGRSGGDGLRVTLRGLRSLQPASRASVLYAPPVDELGTLQQFCEKLKTAFEDAELLVKDDRPLLLHATILNTIYAKGASRGSRGGRHGVKAGRESKPTLDAQELLDRYEDEVWMEDVPVERIAICKMGASKTVIDGVEDVAYEEIGAVAF